MAKDINFRIKLNVDGKDQVVTASTNVKDLANQLGIARDRSQEFKSALQSFANISMGLQGLSNAIQGLASQMQEYTQAYAAQQQAETQLQQVMRNTMGATEAEVQAIRELCAAQQQLGVVGDEVQLAGAKELAMHVKNMGTIEALIPLMNDLAVKQDGYNVSASTAASVGAMLGKAMEGNFTALQRAGIALSDAQKEILKTGTESERAALLVEVLGQKVGGLNQEMANTDAGRMQQMANTIGDIKERIGEMLGAWAPAIQMAAQFGMALNGIIMLGGGLKTLILAFGSLSRAVGLTALNNKLASASAVLLNRTLVAMGVTSKATAVSVNALKWAIKGLEIATVVGAVVVALTTALEHLMRSYDEVGDEAKEAAQEITESALASERAQNAYANAQSQTFGRLMSDYTRLQEEWKKLTDIHSKMEWIARNADAFRQLGLDVRDVVSAEAAFVKNTANVRKALEARARFAAAQAQLVEEFSIQGQAQAVLDADRRTATAQWQSSRITAKAGEKYYGNITDEMTSNGHVQLDHNGAWVWTQKGAEAYNWETAMTTALTSKGREAKKTMAESQKRVNNILDGMVQSSQIAVDALNDLPKVESLGGGHRGGHGGGGSHGGGTATEAIKFINDPKTKSDFENNIRYYQQQLAKTPETDTQRLRELQAGIQEAQTHLNEIEVNSRSLDYAFDFGTGSLVPKISTEVKSLGTDMLRDFYNSMAQKANDLQRDFGMGLISEDRLREQIERMNKMLEGMHLKPIKLDIDADGIPEKLKAAMEGINQMGQSLGSLGTALKVPELNVAGTLAQAIATLTMAYGTASAQSATMGPWAWLGFSAVGLAQLAAIISSVKNLNKFAEGGIAYGPTLGLFGEYAGASHNPEVVAPLDKLRSMIQPAGFAGNVRFRIEGRELVGVLANETRTSAKAGGRTNIKI